MVFCAWAQAEVGAGEVATGIPVLVAAVMAALAETSGGIRAVYQGEARGGEQVAGANIVDFRAEGSGSEEHQADADVCGMPGVPQERW